MIKLLLALVFFTSMHTLNAQDVSKEIKSEPVRWGMANNFSLKGEIGQLVINLPVQSTLKCFVNRTGETKTFSLQANTAKDLLPGKYDILFQGIKIPLVVVEKGKETRILAGILNSTVKGLWEIWTADSVKIFSAGSPKMVALPVGNYIVKTQGVEIKTIIRDGKISMFSYTKY
jgi:hypothetical protein